MDAFGLKYLNLLRPVKRQNKKTRNRRIGGGEKSRNHRISWSGRNLQGLLSPAPQTAEPQESHYSMLLELWQVWGSDHCPGENFSHAHRGVILARFFPNSFPVCSVLRNTGSPQEWEVRKGSAPLSCNVKAEMKVLRYLHFSLGCLCCWTVNKKKGHAMLPFGGGRAAKYLHLLRKAWAISVQFLWTSRGLWKPSRKGRDSCLMLTRSQRESNVNYSLYTLPCLTA